MGRGNPAQAGSRLRAIPAPPRCQRLQIQNITGTKNRAYETDVTQVGLQSQLPFDAVHGSNSHVRDLGDFFHGVAIPFKQHTCSASLLESSGLASLDPGGPCLAKKTNVMCHH